MLRLVLPVALAALAQGVALRPALAGSPWVWGVVAGAYLVLGGWALHRLWDEGTLAETLTPRGGDISLGVVTAAVLLLASFGARSVLTPPGSPQSAWLLRVYAQVGSSEGLGGATWLIPVVLGVAVLEELTWRSLVLDAAIERLGTRTGWWVAALLYAASLLPSAFVLADPHAGPNPLLVLAALGCGVVWSFLAARTARLAPVMVSHMAFTYFSVFEFRLPGM